MLRAIARTVRHSPDRLLHPIRRRNAMARLKKRKRWGTVHFICLGNINRSAYGVVAYRRAMARRGMETVRAASAGFIGPGRPSPELARAAAARRGLDLSRHRSRLLAPEQVRPDDLVLVMTPKQVRQARRVLGDSDPEVLLLGDLDPRPITRRLIQDPYGHPPEVFERVFDRIDRCVDQLADALVRGSARD
ncbi:MAG TPA: hypothetical protein VK966_03685 [Longimicrobiales bacterium]|nr:hypothetical protein [Longimicrobiales bacterium]